MTFSTVSINWTIFSMAVLGIVYFIVMAFINKITKIIEAEEIHELFNKKEEVKDEEGMEMILNRKFINKNLVDKYKMIFEQIDVCLTKIFIQAFIQAIIYTVVIWLVFTSWFIYHDTYFQSGLATFFGILAAGTVAFISMKFSVFAITRSLIDVNKGQYFGFAGNWLSASCISTGIVSTSIFYVMLFQPLNKYMYMGDGENPPMEYLDFSMAYDHLDVQKQVEHLEFANIGFALAIVTSCTFLRGIPQILGIGMIIGHDMTGTLRSNIDVLQDDIIELTYRKLTIIGKILSLNMVQALDSLCVFSTFNVVINLLTAFTTLRAYHEEGSFQFPLLIVAFMLLISFCVSFLGIMHKKPDTYDENVEQQSTSTFTAQQIRYMMILAVALCGIMFAIVPYIVFPPDNFDVLRFYPTHPMHFMNVSLPSTIICLELGLITQVCIVLLSEYYTSHAFKPVQKAADLTVDNTGVGLIQVLQNSTQAHLILILVLAFFLLFAYTQAGFYGIAMFALSLVSIPGFFLTIFLFQCLCEQTSDITNYGQNMQYKLNMRLNRMMWASGNFQLFLPLLNTSGIFCINLVAIGLFCVIANTTDIIIWDNFVLFGFLLGSVIAYFLKSVSVNSIERFGKYMLNIGLIARKQKLDNPNCITKFSTTDPWDIVKSQFSGEENKKGSNVDKDEQYHAGNMIINILMCTLTILFIAYLFGSKGLVGYMCGLNLVSVHLIFLNILKFYSAKNIRDYNQNKVKSNETLNDPEGLINSVRLSVSLTSTESDSVMIYLLYNILFVLQGARILCLGGFFGKYLEKNANENADKIVNQTIGTAIKTSENIQQSINSMQRQVDVIEARNQNQTEPEVPQVTIDDLQAELRRLKLEDQIVMQSLRSDRIALKEIQKSERTNAVAVELLNENIAEHQAEQEQIQTEINELFAHIKAHQDGRDAEYHASLEAAQALFWRL